MCASSTSGPTPPFDACGFVHESVPAAEVGPRLRAAAAAYRDRLLRPGRHASLRRRPDPRTWSALEYAAHVRDVVLVQRDRVVRALVEDEPAFSPMHRDERALLAGYADEEPADVADGIDLAVGLFDRVFARLGGDQLVRPCVYGFPAPARRDVLWVGRQTLHEAEHHLGDLDRVVAAVASRGG